MFKQMQYFMKVVETHSFTKAAEECYISQSAISQQMKALEETLGVQLLIRSKRSFSLTLAGEYFYNHCQNIINDVEELCRKTKEVQDDENVLKIGYLRSFNGREIQETIIKFSKLYPNVHIDIIRGNHEELYNELKNENVSFVISDQRRSFHDDYVNYQLLHMDCFLEVSNSNELSNQKIIDVNQVKDMTCILVTSPSQQEIEKEFYENIIGLKCRYHFVSDLNDARMMVSINHGIHPTEDNDAHDSHIKAIPLYRNGKQIQRNYCAFWKKTRTNYYIEEFVEILRNKLRENHQE